MDVDPKNVRGVLLDAVRFWAERQPVSIEAWDAQGGALFVNQAWRILWQMPEQVLIGSNYCLMDDTQLQGKPVWESLYKGFAEKVALETPPSWYDPRQEDGRPGRPRWTEGRIVPLWSGEDALDETEGPIAFVILLHDVTQMMRSRQVLARTGDELQDGLRQCAHMKRSALRAWAKGRNHDGEDRNRTADYIVPASQGANGPLGPNERILRAPAPQLLLSSAEKQALSLLAEGYCIKEAGAVLGKSEKTLYTQCTAAMRKLGLSSLAELTVYACRWYN